MENIIRAPISIETEENWVTSVFIQISMAIYTIMIHACKSQALGTPRNNYSVSAMIQNVYELVYTIVCIPFETRQELDKYKK